MSRKLIAFEPRLNIIRNGLILWMDASLQTSYPGSGATWSDLSGNSNNATLANAPSFVSDNGGAFSFNGSNNTIVLDSTSPFNLVNITISVWFKMNTSSNTFNLVYSRYGNTNLVNGIILYVDSNTRKFYVDGREDGSLYISTGASNFTGTYGNWYHFTAVKSGNVWSMYINGSFDKSTVQGAGNVSFSNNQANIGSALINGITFSSNHLIGSTLIYNRALSADEITHNYNRTKSRFGL